MSPQNDFIDCGSGCIRLHPDHIDYLTAMKTTHLCRNYDEVLDVLISCYQKCVGVGQ